MTTTPTQRPHPVSGCDEPVCPCPSAACAISRWADESRGPDGRALAAVTLLNQAAGAVRAHLERTVLHADRLSWTGWQVLAAAETWGSIETRDLASQVAVSKATLSGLLDTLVGRGLVARTPFPGDARRVLVMVTPAGRDLVARLFPLAAEAEADLVDELTDAEMAALCNATRVLLRRTASSGATGP